MRPGRPEQRSRLLNVIEAGRRIEVLVEQDRHRRSAGDDGLERPSVQHALRVLLAVDQLAQRRVHRRFVHAGPLHVAADAIELRAAILFGAEAGKPLGTVEDDQRNVAERLDVVHGGRALIQTGDSRERRLDARLRALALERLDERRLLACFVRAGAAMHVDVAVETAAEDVLPEEPGAIGLLDRALERFLHVVELAADVDVGDLGADRVAADRAPFDEQVRIALHEHVILERARLALVSVARDVLRLRRVLEDELPLEPRRESGAATAAQPRRLHLLDDVVRLERQRFPQSLVPARVLHVEVERVRVRLADVIG